MKLHYSILVLLIGTSSAIADDTSAAPSLAIGAKFTAHDTLNCGNDPSTDASECLAGLYWKPGDFTVELEPASPGCGEFLVRFPSPRPIGNAKNDRVSMEWFAAKDDDNKIKSARAIVVVHESGKAMTVGRVIARGVSGQGLHAFLVHMPGYGARRDAKLDKKDQTLPALQQGIADVRRARDAVFALPLVDRSIVGVQGTSMGGFVAATIAGLDHGYNRVFILLAGGNLDDVVLNGSKDAAKTRERLTAAGVTVEQIKEMVRHVEPMRLAHRVHPSETWLFSGKYDDVVPPRCSKAFADAAHLPEGHHIVLNADHYSGAVFLPQIVTRIHDEMIAATPELPAKTAVKAAEK